MKYISIFLISLFSIFLIQCGSTYHNNKDQNRYSKYSPKIISDSLKVKIKVESPTIRWKRNGERENVNIQATFYNNSSENLLIRNAFCFGRDGIFSVIDSSGKELEAEYDLIHCEKKYSNIQPKDSSVKQIIFPILYFYSLKYYGKYKIYLRYWGYFIKNHTQIEDWGDSVVVSGIYKPWKDSAVISDTIEVQYVKDKSK